MRLRENFAYKYANCDMPFVEASVEGKKKPENIFPAHILNLKII